MNIFNAIDIEVTHNIKQKLYLNTMIKGTEGFANLTCQNETKTD